MKRAWVWAAAGAVAIGLAAPAAAQPGTLETYEFTGAVGAHPIGLSLTIKGAAQVWVAHYFYDSQLKDIALVGSESGSTLTLMEAGGGLFKLKLRGDGGSGGDGRDLSTSVGAAGTWTQGAQTLTVTLSLEGARDGAPDGHRYADVTQASDAAFEAMVKALLADVLAGNKAGAAVRVSYPLAVNGKQTTKIRSAAQLRADWDQVFTPALLAQLRSAVPHEMFVHEGQAMVAGGAAWFDAKGLSAINEP